MSFFSLSFVILCGHLLLATSASHCLFSADFASLLSDHAIQRMFYICPSVIYQGVFIVIHRFTTVYASHLEVVTFILLSSTRTSPCLYSTDLLRCMHHIQKLSHLSFCHLLGYLRCIPQIYYSVCITFVLLTSSRTSLWLYSTDLL